MDLKIYQRYLIFKYIKNFFIIFFALEFFYVGVDLLSNLKNLPQSANLQLLYVSFNALVAINYALPLSLVFGLIMTKVFMIRSNELISMYTSGIAKNQVIAPMFFVSLFITLVFVGLNFTQFAKVSEYKRNLIHHNKIATNSEKLFVRYKQNYIYFDKLNLIQKIASNIKIFSIEDYVLRKIISAKNGVFKDDAWNLYDVNIVQIPKEKYLFGEGVIETNTSSVVLLKGFKPSIIDSMQRDKIALSIQEAKDALIFLSQQGANTNAVKSSLYTLVFFPFFAPLMSMLLFYYFPLIGRFGNLAFFTTFSVFITLCVWGVIFILSRFAANGIILPEFGIILPIILMMLYAIGLFYKYR